MTGAAGFIGSNLVESLLRLGQEVVALDNVASGYRRNLDETVAGRGAAERFAITWPVANPVVSVRDAAAPLLRDLPREHLFE